MKNKGLYSLTFETGEFYFLCCVGKIFFRHYRSVNSFRIPLSRADTHPKASMCAMRISHELLVTQQLFLNYVLVCPGGMSAAQNYVMNKNFGSTGILVDNKLCESHPGL